MFGYIFCPTLVPVLAIFKTAIFRAQGIDNRNKKVGNLRTLSLSTACETIGGMNHLHVARLSNDMVKILPMVLLSEQMLLHAIEEDLDRRSHQ